MIIRRYRPDDFDPVTDLWRRSRLAAFPDVQARTGYTAEDDRAYFRRFVQADNALWVAEVDGGPAAFMALSPARLSLRTFQMNANGRAFYEKNGFVIARFGVSPPPESEPDVEYRWQP